MNVKKIAAFAVTGVVLMSMPAFAHGVNDGDHSGKGRNGETSQVCVSGNHRSGSADQDKRVNMEGRTGSEHGRYGRNDNSSKSGGDVKRSENRRDGRREEGLKQGNRRGENRSSDISSEKGERRGTCRSGENRQDAEGKGRMSAHSAEKQGERAGKHSNNDSPERDSHGTPLKDGSGPGQGNKDGFHRNRDK